MEHLHIRRKHLNNPDDVIIDYVSVVERSLETTRSWNIFILADKHLNNPNEIGIDYRY